MIELKPLPIELVLLGLVRIGPSSPNWMFLNPGETWAHLPPQQRSSVPVRVHLN